MHGYSSREQKSQYRIHRSSLLPKRSIQAMLIKGCNGELVVQYVDAYSLEQTGRIFNYFFFLIKSTFP